MPCFRNIEISLNSVALFPTLRTRDMHRERSALVKTSAIDCPEANVSGRVVSFFAFVEGAENGLKGLLGFAFEDFEEEGELGSFDGLGIDINAVNVGDEDAFAFADGEAVVAGDTPHPCLLPSEGRGRRIGDLDESGHACKRKQAWLSGGWRWR